MTDPQRWRRVRALFELAQDSPPAEREARVRAAEPDAALASEVLAWLEKSERVGEFLEPPPAPEPAPDGLNAGDRVGGFELVSELGQGGMGVVWLARQDNPRRTVALKLLRAVALAGESERRFRREAEILARLAHPGIAQVYEAGTDERGGVHRPWFALELVEGAPIDTHARQRGLDLRARVGLLAKVCDAVQHAHERGVVHRDLKPANILVTPAGEPKVLDFGVARAALGEGEPVGQPTRTGLLLGTLDYMSPEQLAGDPEAVDARADVYALGVVLNELLAGRRPHAIEGLPIPEALRVLSEDAPASLASYDRALRGDLETIVAKALEKERARRYASAAELALDLRRFLAERPIAARPASTIYQLRKFARRNRGLVAGVAAAFAFLVVGVAGTTTEMLRALAAEGRAETRRAEAERSASEAREVQGFLEDILQSIQPDVAAGQDTALVRRMLDDAARRVEGRFASEPLVEAALRTTLGRSYESIGLYEEARAQHERALALLRAHAAAGSPQLGASLGGLASALRQAARSTEAEPLLREALALERARSDPSTHDLACALHNLAGCLSEQRRYADAEALDAEAARVLESAAPAETEALPPVLAGWGTAVMAQGRLAEAEPLLVRALEVEQRVHPEAHTQRVECLKALSALHWKKQDWEAALSTTRESLEISRKLYGEKHPALLDRWSNLAMAYAQQGDLEQAEAAARNAVDLSRELHAEARPNFAIRLRDLGFVLKARGRVAEAEVLFRDALARQRELLAPQDPGRIETLYDLAELLRESDRPGEAGDSYREALELSRQALGPDHATTRLLAGKLDALAAAPAGAPR
jgi:tetratricopeptide (TPR) repeat protein